MQEYNRKGKDPCCFCFLFASCFVLVSEAEWGVDAVGRAVAALSHSDECSSHLSYPCLCLTEFKSSALTPQVPCYSTQL